MINAESVPFEFENIKLKEACWINGDPYFTRRAIGEWLEYADPKEAIEQTIRRNPHIQDSRWSTTVKLTAFDGKGYETEVYSPIGFQLIVFESSQPKAKIYKVAVAHLVVAYTQCRLNTPAEELKATIANINRRLQALEARPSSLVSFPNDRALPISMERKRRRSFMPGKGLRSGEVRQMVVELRLQLATYEQIAQAVKDAYPDEPEKHVSKSAVARFWNRLRKGELKEFGMDLPQA